MELLAIVVMQIFIHAMWLVVPMIVDSDDIADGARYVTLGSAAIAAVGIVGLLMNKRWGWWVTLILSIVNLFLTVPEIASLEGVLRVSSIVAIACIIAILVLLFRPSVRHASR